MPLKAVGVDGARLSVAATTAVMDSGTHLIITSDADAQAINQVNVGF
jgi:hypothetical protein